MGLSVLFGVALGRCIYVFIVSMQVSAANRIKYHMFCIEQASFIVRQCRKQIDF